MDALVCGLPRSGTTLIANLMHDPGEGRICLVEPLLNGKSGNLKNRAKSCFSLPMKRGLTLTTLQGVIPRGTKWAIKECWAERYRYAYYNGAPKMVIFVIRDLLDTMLSLYNFAGGEIGVDSKVAAAKEFLEFIGHVTEDGVEHYFVQYETIGMAKAREAFGAVTEWPLSGDPSRDLKSYGREDEIREGFAPRIENPVYPDDVLEIVNQCQDYQRRFNYYQWLCCFVRRET